MANRTITVHLNTQEIDGLEKYIIGYAKEIQRRGEIFVEELADIGITVAKQKLNGFPHGELVYFTKDISDTGTGVSCILYADASTYTTEWLVFENGAEVTKSAEVNPLLMAEFGSGSKAIEGHRGTFPNQKHAFAPFWHWKDTNNNWHTSSGTTPTRPLASAVEEMKQQIGDVAKRVFSV